MLKAQPATQPPLSGVATIVDSVRVPAGYFVRTYLTTPSAPAASRRLPAILFVQWLSCDPVSVPSAGGDGWALMLRTLIQESGMVVARTEKPGVGGSGGPACSDLGYNEELAAHRATLDRLRGDPRVWPDSIFLFGASMGGTMVPLLAAEGGVAGIIVWGSTGLSWMQHLQTLDRRVLRLQGIPDSTATRWLREHDRLYRQFLVQAKAPTDLIQYDSTSREAWTRIAGSLADNLYGRPFAFHQEAQRADWHSAWTRVRAPVFVIRGAFDWIMGEEDHASIVDAVNAGGSPRASLSVVPGTDHHFSVFPNRADAYREVGGMPNRAAADSIMRWIRSRRSSSIRE